MGAIRRRATRGAREDGDGAEQDRPDRRREHRRHARSSGGPQGTRGRRRLRHREGPAAGEGARSRRILAGRGVRLEDDRRPGLLGDQGRRRRDRHRRRDAKARDEPRRSGRGQHEGDDAGGRRDQTLRAGRLRDLRHQPSRRHGVGVARGDGLPPQQGRGHGRGAGFRQIPLLPRRGVRRLGRGRDRVRPRRARRFHGPLAALLRRRGHPPARSRQAGLDHEEAGGRDRAADPGRRRRDRQPDEDGIGLLRAGELGHRHGGVLPQGQEAGAALRRLAGRPVRRPRPVRRRPGRHRRRRGRARDRDRPQQVGTEGLRELRRVGPRPDRRREAAGARTGAAPPDRETGRKTSRARPRSR